MSLTGPANKNLQHNSRRKTIAIEFIPNADADADADVDATTNCTYDKF